MQNYKCKVCDGDLVYDGKKGKLVCPYCDAEYTEADFEDATQTTEEVADENIKEVEYLSVDVKDGMVAYACTKCGGAIITSKTTMADTCPYCGENISITSKSVGKFRPDLVLPFKVEKKEATKIYEDYVKKAKYSPKEFMLDGYVSKIQGLFAPFWLHDLSNKSKHIFEGEIQTVRTEGEYRITKHEVYELTTIVKCKYDKIPTDGSIRLDDKMMKCIEPYKYEDLKNYNPMYMTSYLAEQVDENEESMNTTAETRSKENNYNQAKKMFSKYSALKDIKNAYKIEGHTHKYAMLPVWTLNVKHKEKNYQFMINGQTGKITGKLPLDYGKVAKVGGITFGVVDLIVSLLQMGGLL